MEDLTLAALFPLELVVFPGQTLNLHIFEARYRQLIVDATEEQIEFCIPYYKVGEILKYGTKVKVSKIAMTYPDGKMDIVIKGIRPIKVMRYLKNHPQKLYPGGFIVEPYWDNEGISSNYISIKEKIQDLYQYMNISEIPDILNSSFTTFEIANKVGFSIEEEYRFLQIPSEEERQDFMLNHLSIMIPKVKEMEVLRKKIQMNGHFRNIIPPKV